MGAKAHFDPAQNVQVLSHEAGTGHQIGNPTGTHKQVAPVLCLMPLLGGPVSTSMRAHVRICFL
ncbi:hypothetical protein [Pseudorhodoferax sp. Leaf265]|uniref:hypothetical protein n=1 Tax=Pseudorhodoferax sp. Leaf265 TaxID=1736315 RepID=UPI001F1FF160|nr:hypothetical protein [Pseudorhodoferax sp. Leaf265]